MNKMLTLIGMLVVFLGCGGKLNPTESTGNIIEIRKSLNGNSYDSDGHITIEDSRIKGANVINVYIGGVLGGTEILFPIHEVSSLSGDFTLVELIADQNISAYEAGSRFIQIFYSDGKIIILDSNQFLREFVDDIAALSNPYIVVILFVKT